MDLLNQIETARRNLLDLSMRNRLLNFRPNKKRSIRVVDELPNEIYDLLVINEKLMEFKAKEVKENGLFETDINSYNSNLDQINSEESKDIDVQSSQWDLTSDLDFIPEKYRDRFLQTNIDSDSLPKRLFYINQQAKSVFDEQGYSVLFLALGFLEWKESPDSLDLRKAPIILIPVELERTGVRKSFHLKWTGEEIFSNISLSAKLQEMGIVLPDFQMPEEKSGIEEYFVSIANSIKDMVEWRLVNDIYLDFFSFTKFVMYKDLDPKSWSSETFIIDHPLFKAVLEPTPESSEYEGFLPNDMDSKLVMKDLFHIMDADPYQIAVIEDIKAGKNLVVEGPPGTGKSQTIANAIAELLVAGKTVLFVSEKMAALEVVKDRLDHVGLGNYCLEIHSRKASKKDVLKELERSTIVTPQTKKYSGEGLEEFESLRKELNEYVKALREPFGKLCRSPYSLFQMKEAAIREFAKSGNSLPRVSWNNISTYGQEDWNQAIIVLKELKEIACLITPILSNPWRGCKPSLILPSDENDIENEIEKCQESIIALKISCDNLSKEFNLKIQQTPIRIEQMLQAGSVIIESPKADKHVLLNKDWNAQNDFALSLINHIVDCQSQISDVLVHFKVESLEKNVKELLSQYTQQLKKPYRFFVLHWWQLLNDIRKLYKHKAPWQSKLILPKLQKLETTISRRMELRQQEKNARLLFGSFWRAENSNVQFLKSFTDWIVRFRSCINNELINEKAVDAISRGINKNYLTGVLNDGQQKYSRFLESREELFKLLNIDCNIMFGVNATELEVDVFRARLDILEKSIASLQKWSHYINYREKCRSTIASPLIGILENDQVDPQNMIACFTGNYADGLLHEVFNNRKNLATFIGDLHEKRVARFCNLDSTFILQNRFRLIEKLEQSKPIVIGGAPRGSEVGALLGEFGRKRGHLSIRQLMIRCGRLIQKLRPCFMMSPLSIAQFLDPQSINFDVILFDEASQVKPEDALGSLLRGNQLIVMGDTKQLPPTSFFDSVVSGLDEDETEMAEISTSDIESILHQCKRSFPSKLLCWHYRSKHESLVAVSNREFYDNRLLIFPSPIDKSDTKGLHFKHLSNAIYDRGRSSVNRLEAQEVAKAAIEHYRRFPEKSLGVGAFNIRQQQAILEEIELQLHENIEMEDFFNSSRFEHFFVKNLETIQGDERDVIFVSVGFGFDENRKLSLNFGPINRPGGERRLNVLMTRARERCVIFSNFRAADLMLDSTSPFGLRALKTFLAFAEDRIFPKDELIKEDTDSPFEDSVYEFLQDNGYKVRKQVGCASFRIDLAVIDSNSPGEYLVGIECDGQKYHTSPVARDRDRLRQQILEGLGWKIIRIWSTDWYRNRIECQNRLLKALVTLKENRITTYLNTLDPETKSPQNKSDNIKIDIHNDINRQTIMDIVPKYIRCESLDPIIPIGELHRQPMNKIAEAVVAVVKVESPVHKDEVIRRIRTLWGVSRTGERIQEAINNGISFAVRKEMIRRKNNFLFDLHNDIVPRFRRDDPTPTLNIISSEEIIEAIKLVLNKLFSMTKDNLITQTCRVFGIQVTHKESASRIERIVKNMIEEEMIEQLSNNYLKLT